MNICCKIKIHFSTKTFSALCWGQIATTVELILLFSLSLFWSWFSLLSCELSICPVLNWSAFLLKERVTKIFFCFLNIFYCNSIKPIKKNQWSKARLVCWLFLHNIHQLCTKGTERCFTVEIFPSVMLCCTTRVTSWQECQWFEIYNSYTDSSSKG